MLKIKTPAPDFTLPDQNGKEHSLTEYRGDFVLVYFYPKDDTPGCTKEACVIRDMYNDFQVNNVKVFGISADSVESHKKFAEKYQLPFILLSDPEKKVIKMYEANSPLSSKRISYLVGPDGNIEKTYPEVDPTYHGIEILKDVQSLLLTETDR
ncbi:MAG: peroxiredoxin [Candidatus Paceibacterota bacterium]|jgi:peroxiredoxin Q/BCP